MAEIFMHLHPTLAGFCDSAQPTTPTRQPPRLLERPGRWAGGRSSPAMGGTSPLGCQSLLSLVWSSGPVLSQPPLCPGVTFSQGHKECCNTYPEKPRKEPARCHSAASKGHPWCSLAHPLSRCYCGGRIQSLFWHTGPASPDSGENTEAHKLLLGLSVQVWENGRFELFFKAGWIN